MNTKPNEELENAITDIFITIDNYGTAEEARVDIRKLIAEAERRAVLKELELALDKSDAHLTLEGFTMRQSYIKDRLKQLTEIEVSKGEKEYLCQLCLSTITDVPNHSCSVPITDGDDLQIEVSGEKG